MTFTNPVVQVRWCQGIPYITGMRVQIQIPLAGRSFPEYESLHEATAIILATHLESCRVRFDPAFQHLHFDGAETGDLMPYDWLFLIPDDPTSAIDEKMVGSHRIRQGTMVRIATPADAPHHDVINGHEGFVEELYWDYCKVSLVGAWSNKPQQHYIVRYEWVIPLVGNYEVESMSMASYLFVRGTRVRIVNDSDYEGVTGTIVWLGKQRCVVEFDATFVHRLPQTDEEGTTEELRYQSLVPLSD